MKGQATEVLLQVGSTTATVNGKKVTLPAAPVQREGRVLIPLSSFSNQFGVQVSWNQATKTVSLVSPQREMHLRAFYALQSFQEKDLIPSMNSVAFGWSRIDREGQFTLQGMSTVFLLLRVILRRSPSLLTRQISRSNRSLWYMPWMETAN